MATTNTTNTGNMDTADFISSNLSNMEYDNQKKLLRLSFNAGGTYEYYSVPQMVVYELQQAESAGSYFHRFIRDKYKYKKVA